MPRVCEVCEHLQLEPPTSARPRLRRLLVEDRLVSLCELHSVLFQASGKTTLDELRELFREPNGRRSLVDRRAPLDRRVFPARPEGRRRAQGRRERDSA